MVHQQRSRKAWVFVSLLGTGLLLTLCWLVASLHQLQLQNNALVARLQALEHALPEHALPTNTGLSRLGLLHNPLDDQFNIRLPRQLTTLPQLQSRQFHGDFEIRELSLQERVRYLELKANARMNWGKQYALDGLVQPEVCAKVSNLAELDPKCLGKNGRRIGTPSCGGMYDHRICLDDLHLVPHGAPPPPGADEPPCLVYDFGIREQPHFGVTLAEQFGCEVHAFDPSPISVSYWKNQLSKRKVPDYHFHPYGAGGIDGNIKLYEYNWGQVSLLKYPMYLNHSTCLEDGRTHCTMEKPAQESFTLPVRTLPSIMKQLGHKHISVLKIDVEGAEFALLEDAFDQFGCLPIQQITIEWHHFSLDPRYGDGSSPDLNTLTTLLHRCGFRQFWKGSTFPTPDAVYHHMGMHNMRINIASYMRVPPSQSDSSHQTA